MVHRDFRLDCKVMFTQIEVCDVGVCCFAVASLWWCHGWNAFPQFSQYNIRVIVSVKMMQTIQMGGMNKESVCVCVCGKYEIIL